MDESSQSPSKPEGKLRPAERSFKLGAGKVRLPRETSNLNVLFGLGAAIYLVEVNGPFRPAKRTGRVLS